MRIPKIHTHLMSRRGCAKKIAQCTKLTKTTSKSVIKKVVPATMFVTESIMPASAQISVFNTSPFVSEFVHYDKNLLRFVPFALRSEFKQELLAAKFKYLTPKNKFKQNTANLRGRYQGTAEELDYFIEKLIPARNGKKDYNPFYKKGQSFIDIAGKYDVNPTVLVAIGMFESGRGTSVAAIKKKNIGGIYLKNQHATFERVEECIEHMAKTIDKNIKANLNSIEAIGLSGKYCDISVGELWAKNVTYFINKM